MSSSDTDPTLENILPEYVPSEGRFGASKPSSWAYEQGARAAVPGLSGCPWCDADTKELEERNYIAICVKNPKHIVQWLPWGG